MDEVVAELKAALSSRPDYITLSGSGEPTLYSRTGELIDSIKTMTDVPIAVLTNGSLLWQPAVRSQLMGADLVIPSLDAGDGPMFQAVNRPHPEITFEQMLQGLIAFRNEYRGQYWLEVFLVAGHNEADAEVRRIAECVGRIRPHRVQLNTVTRPPAEDRALAVDRRRLEALAAAFDPPAEVIADFQAVALSQRREFAAGREAILELLRRRPCSLQQVADGLGMHLNEVVKIIEGLRAEELLEQILVGEALHYRARKRQ